MNSKRRFSLLALLSVIAWIVGSLLILGPGMASKNPDSPEWLLAGILLQVVGFLFLLAASSACPPTSTVRGTDRAQDLINDDTVTDHAQPSKPAWTAQLPCMRPADRFTEALSHIRIT